MTQLVTILRLCLAAVIICSSSALPLGRHKQAVLFEGSKSAAPQLNQLQETGLSGTRSNELPANSVRALESRREMRQAETTTTAQNMESSQSTPSASGDNEAEQTSQQRQLRDLLQDYYTNPRSKGREQPGSFLVYFDLFATGPLSVDGDKSRNAIESHKSVCTSIATEMNTNRDAKDLCYWRYSCEFNENRFPSSIINATSCEASQGARCVARIQQIMTFTRTSSRAGATWRKAGEVSVIYGYTCRKLH